jgi:FkbM family methyltransferase
MLKIIRIILTYISNIIHSLSVLIYRSPQEKRVVHWFNVNGDKTYRLNYNLNQNSLVLDLGGYEGQWTSDIFSIYCCNIMIFEPVTQYAENIRQRFQKNPQITIYEFGLSNETKYETLSIKQDGSSIYDKGGKLCQIYLIKAIDFFKNNNVNYVDLMKINIEGGEYDLLDHLLDTNLVESINNIQVQFHDFVPDAESRMKKIQSRLEITHYLTYQYPFVWENWALRKKN